MVFWVGELGFEEFERFLFSACCIQPLLFGLFVLFCVDERIALELFIDMFRRAPCIMILLFLLLILIFLFLILVFVFGDSDIIVSD